MTPTTIENSHAASALGTGLERIRANLARFNLAQATEATRIVQTKVEDFVDGRGELSEDELDRLTGFMRGEYALSGTGDRWVRRKLSAPRHLPLPLAADILPVGDGHAHPLGDHAPTAVELGHDAPTLKHVRAAKSHTKPTAADPSPFGRRAAEVMP